MTLHDYIQRALSPARLDRYVLLLWGLAVFGLSVTAHGQSVAVIHCQGECPAYQSPVTAQQSRVVIHHLYAAGVNGRTSLPDWVAYRLTGNAVGVASLLPRTWQADRLVRFSPLEDIAQAGEEEVRLSEMIAENSSPYGGGAGALVKPEDRARLAPITSFANTPYWSELNNFSNMVPMPASLRLGPWLQLEQRLNRLVAGDRELYVLAGPLYLINILSLSPSSTDLEPAAYFKLVADETGIAAFMFPGDADRFSDVCTGRASLAEIQEMSDLNYFPGRRRIRESESLYKELGCQVAVDHAGFIAE
ncbi:MAG: DNA/RNA non-specific endonuclease [Pseudohongiellaceae bacterium]